MTNSGLQSRQAICIGQSQGLNRRFDSSRWTVYEFEHRAKLWWTLYVIDRKLSSLVGISGMHDEDIALPIPALKSTQGIEHTMLFHVQISSYLGQVLDGNRSLGVYYTVTKSICSRLFTRIAATTWRPVYCSHSFDSAKVSLHVGSVE